MFVLFARAGICFFGFGEFEPGQAGSGGGWQ